MLASMQGLQSWLAGPQVNLREGASSSAIVLAVDHSSPPTAHLRRLTQQASSCKKGHTSLEVWGVWDGNWEEGGGD